jgi:hypothetical protein
LGSGRASSAIRAALMRLRSLKSFASPAPKAAVGVKNGRAESGLMPKVSRSLKRIALTWQNHTFAQV